MIIPIFIIGIFIFIFVNAFRTQSKSKMFKSDIYTIKKFCNKNVDFETDSQISDNGAIYCKKCGGRIDSDSAYCKHCGSEVE